jgi:protein-S-isoprenylcysteine O-methyltransferase Ste14
MRALITRAALGLAFLLATIGAALFVPAGTVDYWQAWMFLATFGSLTLAITIYLAVADPALLARRVSAGPVAESRRAQQLIQGSASLAFIAVFVVAGFDHRFGWSHEPNALAIAGDILVALGLGGVALVFRANTFTASTITVEREQQVVSTGPYAIVRHPMYACALVMMLGVPFSLGSYIAVPLIVPLYIAIVLRLLDEEQTLVRELAGYADYREKVRYRLVPYVW